MARTRYHILPIGRDWKLTKEGSASALFVNATKTVAVDKGGEVASVNQPSQLIVHRQDRTIETEHTYGSDPFPARPTRP